MTAPPPLNLDPITGLPSDFLAPDLYQIPLNSRPQLAPEWSPDHLPPNALHPDNMPSMFATIQAQNQLNPGLPQACTTDGAGNLNVNVRQTVSSGGGGGNTGARAAYAVNAYGINIGGSGASSNIFTPWLSSPPLVTITSITLTLTVSSVITSGGTHVVDIRLLDSTKTFEIALFYAVIGISGTLYGDGRYQAVLDFVPAIDIAATWGTNVPLQLYYSSSNCTWSGAIIARGTAV